MEGRPVVRVDPDDTKGPTGSAVPTAGRPTKPREEPQFWRHGPRADSDRARLIERHD